MPIGDIGSWLGGALSEDLADFHDGRPLVRVVVRLVFAAVLGGALGWQREHVGKAAGLRTHMLTAMGAALFLMAAAEAGIAKDQLSRVIQGIVTGIGFVGAGVILKLTEQRQVKGLTTAASVWMAAAVGVAAGLGRETFAVLGVLLALLVLSVLGRAEHWIEGGHNEDRAREHTHEESRRHEAADGPRRHR
jgi:putative Mg2+ transporter-C (MgtC) family protein